MGSAASLQQKAESLQKQIHKCKINQNKCLKIQNLNEEGNTQLIREFSSSKTRELTASNIQQNRLMFKKSGNIHIKTPSRDQEYKQIGIPIRQSRFSKTQVFSTDETAQEKKNKYQTKKCNRETIVIDNTPTSTRLKGNRRGSLNNNNIFESIGSKKQFSFKKLASAYDFDQEEQQRKTKVFGETTNQCSIYDIDDEQNKQKLSSQLIGSQTDSQQTIPKQNQGNEDDDSEIGSEMYDSQSMTKTSNNYICPIPRRSNQKMKTMLPQLSKNTPLESLQEKEEIEEVKSRKSKNYEQGSPLYKQIFHQKIMSMNNFNIPQLTPDHSPIQMFDDVLDGFDQIDIQFSLQSMQPTEIELCEVEQLNQIRESIQLQQQQSQISKNEEQSTCYDRKNFHNTTDDNLNRSLDSFSGRSNSQKRTTFRSLGLKTVNQYEIGCALGEGQYGKVRYAKVYDEGGKICEFAIKYFKKQQLRKMKQFYKDEKGRTKIFTGIQTVQSEIAVMKKLEHENIVKLYEVIEDNENDKIYLVIDFAQNGQLIEYDELRQHFHLEKKHQEKGTIEGEIEYLQQSQTEYKISDCSLLNEDELQKEPVFQTVKEKVFFIDESLLRKIFRDCIKGLGYWIYYFISIVQYQYSFKFKYIIKNYAKLYFQYSPLLQYQFIQFLLKKDLKPQNILFTDNDAAVITDFSISLILGEQKVLKQDQGTLCFMAPELIENQKNSDKNNDFYKRADIWSLGVTFFSFIFYSLPYKSTNLEDLFDEISTTNLEFPKTRSISYGLKLVLKAMLNINPLERVTLEQFTTIFLMNNINLYLILQSELIDDQWINDGGFGHLRDEIETQEKVVVSQSDIKQAMVNKSEIAFLNGSMIFDSSSSQNSYSVFESNRSIQCDGIVDRA